MPNAQIRICFVCLGNICRSPTAEGVMKKLVADAGLGDRIFIDSAGTGAWHEGELADPRSRAEALRRGLTLTSIARQVVAEDFDDFDYLIAMDRQNERDLKRLANDSAVAPELPSGSPMGAGLRSRQRRAKISLLRSYADKVSELDVPDPYQDGPRGFVDVYDICVSGCTGLLAHLRGEHGL